MNTTTEKLDVLVGKLKSTIGLCLESKNKVKLLDSLSSTVSEIDGTIVHLKDVEKRKYLEVRKSLSVVKNVMSGMVDGLNSKTIGREEFVQASDKLANKFFPQVRQSLITELELQSENSDEDRLRPSPVSAGTFQKIKIVLSKTSEIKDALKVVSSASTIISSSDGDTKMSELETMAHLARTLLPVRIERNFQIVRVPIVPIFPNPTLSKSETLKKLSLKHIVVKFGLKNSPANFTILQEQILLLVSKKRAAASTSATPLAMAHSAVDLINARSTVQYEIVSDTPQANPRNTDLLMYWILPRAKMAGLMKMLGTSKSPSVVKWGLPLPHEKADSDAQKIERQRLQDIELEQKRNAVLTELGQQREAAQLAKEANRERAKQKRAAEQNRLLEAKKARIQARKDAENSVLKRKLSILVNKNKSQHGKK